MIRGVDGRVYAFNPSYRDSSNRPGVWWFDPDAKRAAGKGSGEGDWIWSSRPAVSPAMARIGTGIR